MTNVAAAILCGQMERREQILDRRRQIWNQYVDRLSRISGIETRPMLVPLHTLPPYRHLLHRTAPLPVTDRLGEQGIMLPTFTALTDQQIERICSTILTVAARRQQPARYAA